MKKVPEASLFPSTYSLTIQFLWDWYNHLKLDNLPSTLLPYIRQFAFFDKRIVYSSQNTDTPSLYRLKDLPSNSGLYQSGYFHTPFHNDPLNVSFQCYMTKIATKLYKENKDLLGNQPDIIFYLDPHKKNIGAGIYSDQYPPHIIFPLDEIGTLYQTEDQLAATLAHELIHLSIMQKSVYRILTRTEEALADLLGTLIISRAGYRPSQNILFMANTDTNAVSIFQLLQQNIIPSQLTPEEIICIAEVADFKAITIPKNKLSLFQNKRLAFCKGHHPHPATRMIYLNKLNEYLYNIGLLHESDPFSNGRPINFHFLMQVQKRQKSIVRIPLKKGHKKYISHRIYPNEKTY